MDKLGPNKLMLEKAAINLGSIYKDLGDFGQAEDHRRALAITLIANNE